MPHQQPKKPKDESYTPKEEVVKTSRSCLNKLKKRPGKGEKVPHGVINPRYPQHNAPTYHCGVPLMCSGYVECRAGLSRRRPLKLVAKLLPVINPTTNVVIYFPGTQEQTMQKPQQPMQQQPILTKLVSAAAEEFIGAHKPNTMVKILHGHNRRAV
jgi:hypothetical protein